MSKITGKKTRREFLEVAAVGAASATLASMESRFVFAQSQSKGRADTKVFSEGQLGKVTCKNRLVRSATWEASGSNGEVTDGYINIYRVLAAGGVGMIISGYMGPYAGGGTQPAVQIHIDDDKCIPGLKRVADAVRGTDCRLVAQIGHGGYSIGPSEVGWRGQKPRALSTGEVENLVESFAQGIRRVKESGWDGVELHGAHSYLLCSFLSPITNQRTDRFGGSTENRVQVVKEIISQAREQVGPDFLIMIKANCNDEQEGGITLETWPEQAKALVNAGVDAIDISSNNPMPTEVDTPEEESYHMNGAEALETIGVPIICTGGNRNIDRMEKLLQTSSKVDFLGLARPLVRQPDLPGQWLKGNAFATPECIYCNGCLQAIRSGPVQCVQEG